MSVGLEKYEGHQIKNMKVDNAAGIYPNRLVVYGTSEGDCTVPSGIGVSGVIGVIQGVDDNTTLLADNEDVKVVTGGVVYVETYGAVDYGEAAKVYDNTGKACGATQVTPSATNIVGYFEETTTDSGLALLNLQHNGDIVTV